MVRRPSPPVWLARHGFRPISGNDRPTPETTVSRCGTVLPTAPSGTLCNGYPRGYNPEPDVGKPGCREALMTISDDDRAAYEVPQMPGSSPGDRPFNAARYMGRYRVQPGSWRSSPVFSTTLVGCAALVWMDNAKSAPGGVMAGMWRTSVWRLKRESASDDRGRPGWKAKRIVVQDHDRWSSVKRLECDRVLLNVVVTDAMSGIYGWPAIAWNL